ncbi:AraC family transcriptional regulator [Atopomonas sediminilitoris]|uniref:AraC family transcriptional regulator n=1 Tax=Atopomonas sediminilitoris TaxID=2919919 RepID=UPI0027954C7E|nr:AraC family transcriptional regulator [Atopomonas sediminilitoris]
MTATTELVPTSYVQALLSVAQERGVDSELLCRLGKVSPALLANPDGRLSFIDFSYMVAEAISRSDSPGLGLAFGQKLNVSSHGMLGYAVMASSDLRQALQFVLRYYKVLGLAYELELLPAAPDSDTVILQAKQSIPLGPLAMFAVEALFASLFSIAEFLLGEKVTGHHMAFSHPRPSHHAQYQQIFAAEVSFDQPWDALTIPAHYLARPMALANPATVQMCERQCDALLAKLDVHDGLLTRVRRLLLARPGDFPSLEDAASALHTSGRTLRRHLSSEGTSYQQVLDDVRRSLALQYLETRLPLHEIAALLGFSDASNFRRAFKQWTGNNPSQYRAEQESP